MTMPLKQIEAEALQLPPTELDMLIANLKSHRDSLADGDTPEVIAAAWNAEITRRLDEIDHGEVEWIPGAQVFAEINEKLRKAGA